MAQRPQIQKSIKQENSQVNQKTKRHHLPRASRVPSKFSADQVTWNHESRTLHAKGSVTFVQGDLMLTCETATISLKIQDRRADDQNSTIKNSTMISRSFMGLEDLKEMKASGRVLVQFQNLKLRATEVIYQHELKKLTAQGPLSGSWGQTRLKGDSLTVSLVKQHAQLHNPKFNLLLPALIPQQDQDITTDHSKLWLQR